jgi:5-methyltetrahydropteroyltriglutamate--homocysteine methyltransferase
MKRSTDRILTTHSGSLPRSAALHDLLEARSEGKEIDESSFAALVRESVTDVVRRQVEAGVTVPSDGEQSKIGFAYYLMDRLSGFELDPDYFRPRFPPEAADFPEYYARPSGAGRAIGRPWVACVGPIEWKAYSLVEADIESFRSALEGLQVDDAFITSPSPTTAAGFQPNKYYGTEEEYVEAVANALRREYRAIVDAGFLLQVDLPFGYPRSNPEFVGVPMEQTYDSIRSTLDRNVAAVNFALEGIPADQVRLHVCFGSDPGTHHHDPELSRIADILLKANVGAYTLVGGSGRHEFEYHVWEDVKLPEDKVIIAGVIDHTTNSVEHPRTVADRIIRYAGAIGRERVIAGVDCGFSVTSGAEDYRVDPRVMWAKFQSLSQGAEIASAELWA